MHTRATQEGIEKRYQRIKIWLQNDSFDGFTASDLFIMQFIKQELRFHPTMRVVFVSCRVVHAIDLHFDLKRAFPSGCGTEFTIYNDPSGGKSTERLVVGQARVNGRSHRDWFSRQYHKKCWKALGCPHVTYSRGA